MPVGREGERLFEAQAASHPNGVADHSVVKNVGPHRRCRRQAQVCASHPVRRVLGCEESGWVRHNIHDHVLKRGFGGSETTTVRMPFSGRRKSRSAESTNTDQTLGVCFIHPWTQRRQQCLTVFGPRSSQAESPQGEFRFWTSRSCGRWHLPRSDPPRFFRRRLFVAQLFVHVVEGKDPRGHMGHRQLAAVFGRIGPRERTAHP